MSAIHAGPNHAGEPGNIASRVHVAVFFLLTFGIGLLPPVGVTAMGMKVLGVFLGLLYGWSFIGFAWPSMISLVALGFTGYGDPAPIIASAFSHPAVLFTLFVLTFTTYCTQSGINAVMATWFLSRPVFTGRPWVFTASVLVGTLIISFLVDGVPTVFLISSILYSIFADAGFRKGDAYPAWLLAGVCIAGVLSFACKPWAGQNLMGISTLADVSGGTAVIDNLTLIAVAMPVCVATLLAYTLIVRFVFRPDISRLAHLTPDYLASLRRDLRIGAEQAVAAAALLVFLALMFLPNILPGDSGPAAFFGKFSMTVAIVLILGVLSFVRVKGKAAFDFQACSTGINWNVIWMLAASIPVSAAMSSPDAGVSHILAEILGRLAGGSGVILFLILFMIFVNVMTQFTHNVTIVLIAVPIIWPLSQSTGIHPAGFSILLFLAAGAAFATPAASTVGALSFANGEWIGMKRAFQAGILGCVGGLVCMLALGLPLVAVLVGL